MNDVVHIFNVSPDPTYLAAHALATEIMPVSRLQYNCDILKIKSIYSIPEIPSRFDKSFNQISVERAQNIWKNHQQNNSVNILWSGGIDSTMAVVALLIESPSTGILNIYCNMNSIYENKFFYIYLLKQKNVKLRNASLLPENEKFDLITGDLGDQIFGSEMLYKINHLFGFDALSESYDKIIPKLFAARCGEVMGGEMYKRYLPIIDSCIFPIKTAFDFIWWWNFTQKWQGVKFRKQCFLNPNHLAVHFFDSTEYQLWSIFFHDQKIGKKIETYKQPAKEFIFSFDKNESYLLNKKKLGSPYGSHIYYFGLYEDGTQIKTWTECQQTLSRLALHGTN